MLFTRPAGPRSISLPSDVGGRSSGDQRRAFAGAGGGGNGGARRPAGDTSSAALSPAYSLAATPREGARRTERHAAIVEVQAPDIIPLPSSSSLILHVHCRIHIREPLRPKSQN